MLRTLRRRSEGSRSISLDDFRQLRLALNDQEYMQYSVFATKFRDLRQAYGVSSAGFNCQDFTILLVWILEHKTPEFADEFARILAYIDDFTFGGNTLDLNERLTIAFDHEKIRNMEVDIHDLYETHKPIIVTTKGITVEEVDHRAVSRLATTEIEPDTLKTINTKMDTKLRHILSLIHNTTEHCKQNRNNAKVISETITILIMAAIHEALIDGHERTASDHTAPPTLGFPRRFIWSNPTQMGAENENDNVSENTL